MAVQSRDGAEKRVHHVCLPGGRQHSTETIDRFADALAETGHVRQAAEIVGISHSYARLLFSAIKRGLGWQAV